MQPQIYTEVHHNPLTVTTISLSLSLFTLLTHFFYTSRNSPALNWTIKAKLLCILCLLYLSCSWSGLGSCQKGSMKAIYLLYTRQISCTRGCLAEVCFEGFCTNLALQEIKSKPTQREETERLSKRFGWNHFSVVPLLFTTSFNAYVTCLYI